MKKHALLSASGASRWLNCSPSARLEQAFVANESIYADEGTLAHEVGEWLIKQEAWGINVDKALKELQEHPLYSEEMYDYCLDYAKFVAERVRQAPAGSILIQEQRLNLTEYIPEGFGTTDNCIVGDKFMEVIDLKYGKGVPVDAYENKQLMVYALGAYEEYQLIYDIKQVRLTIYQPRIDNTSSYDISAEDLVKWGREVLRPGALKAFEGIGDIIPGDHCRFCRVKPTCKAFARRNLEIAKRDFDPPHLTDEQIVKVLMHGDSIRKWLNSVEEYALKEGLAGRKFPGMKIVQGRSVRKITNEQAILEGLEKAGYDGSQLVNKKITGITNLSKIVSKLHFKELVEPYLYKPPGAPALVSDEDGRPELNSTQSAADDFAAE